MTLPTAVLDLGSNALRLTIITPTETGLNPAKPIFRARYSLEHPLTPEFLQGLLPQVLSTCREWDVPASQTHILATEAVRGLDGGPAIFEYMTKKFPGLQAPKILSGLEEAGYATKAVKARYSVAEGLVLEMGGGSLQMVEIHNPELGVSVPAGAAKVRKLVEAEGIGRAEVTVAGYIEGWKSASQTRWYLTGGGFRALGFLLMDIEGQGHGGYPIPDVDGYVTDVGKLKMLVRNADVPKGKVFGISKRRKTQLPAVFAVARTLLARLKPEDSTEIVFSSTTIADGFLAEMFKDVSNPDHSAYLPSLITAFPHGLAPPYMLELLDPLSKMISLQNHMSKQSAPVAAINYCLHSPKLAGLTHSSRFFLAMASMERYGGKVPGGTVDLSAFMDAETRFWARYFGRLAAVFGSLPPGKIRCQLQVLPDLVVVQLMVPTGVDLGEQAEELRDVSKKKNPVARIDVLVKGY